jgi:DNA polymerase I-like protein with 3'-5' exonuclease and polymerase domains
MLVIDTETTGLHLRAGWSTVFAIGMFDGSTYRAEELPVDPVTRKRVGEFSQNIKVVVSAANMLVFHNAMFDVKALCEAGILDWEEPNCPEFWDKVLDTMHLAHLFNNIDRQGLDALVLKYFGNKYGEERELIDTVNACRRHIRKHNKSLPENRQWSIAEYQSGHPGMRGCGKSTEFARLDYWLPRAVLRSIPASARPKLPDTLLSGVLAKYLKADVTNTHNLARFLMAGVQDDTQARMMEHDPHMLTSQPSEKVMECLNVNRQIMPVMWGIENTGVWVHKAKLQGAIESCERLIEQLTESCKEISGLEEFNDADLRWLFYDNWNMSQVKVTKKKQEPSVDAETLVRLHDEAQPGSPEYKFLAQFLSLRKYTKKLEYLTSYSENRTDSGVIYPSFKVTGTKTTRMSGNNPNLQQVQKAGNPYEDDHPEIAKWLKHSPSMRSVFGPPPGYWWLDCDYSQLQLRIFAVVTNEQEMIDAFRRGWDAHDFTARRIFGISDSDSPSKAQRRIAKNVNFGFIFGASPKKIEQTAGVPGLWGTVLKLFPNAHAFIEKTKREIAETGIVYTAGRSGTEGTGPTGSGYPLHLDIAFNQWSGRDEFKGHAGVNYIVQGTEGVIVKRAMRYCYDYLLQNYPAGRVALQCHDELVFEMPVKFPKKHVWGLVDCMERAALDYGVEAPVDPELVINGWNKSVKIRR